MRVGTFINKLFKKGNTLFKFFKKFPAIKQLLQSALVSHIQEQGFLILLDGFFVAPPSLVGYADIVIHLRLVVGKRQRMFEGFDGLLVFATQAEGSTFKQHGIQIVGM